jgi:hypothetical protein
MEETPRSYDFLMNFRNISLALWINSPYYPYREIRITAVDKVWTTPQPPARNTSAAPPQSRLLHKNQAS